MTFKYNNVYIKDSSTVVGPYEKSGPLGKYFDKSYDDLYMGEKSFEKAEIKLVRESLNILLKKTSYKKKDIDLVIGGDLLNQIISTTFGSLNIGNGFIGVYGACSSSVLSLIIGSSLIDCGKISNAISVVSSHNLSSEKQFRNPVEYGVLRPKSSTFTCTGGASLLLTSKKSNIKVESATIGEVIDYNQNDPNDMGRVMAPVAIKTIKKHLDDLGRDASYYDLIVTGDLGIYGREIVKDYMFEKYNIDLSNNYNDCGVMLYDINTHKEYNAGASGPSSCALVTYSYILDQLKKKKLKRVLVVATGALFSPTSLYQKENILSIAHAISLEVV